MEIRTNPNLNQGYICKNKNKSKPKLTISQNQLIKSILINKIRIQLIWNKSFTYGSKNKSNLHLYKWNEWNEFI